MSLQEIIYRGSLVSTGAVTTINFPAGFDQFILRNRTTLAAGAGIIESRWWLGMPVGVSQNATVAGGAVTYAIAAGGFTYVDSSTATLGAPIAVTGVSAASPSVALTATTPLVGQIVRIYGTTGMLQIAGMDFSVTVVNPGVSMTLGFLPAVGFAAPATAGTYRLVPVDLKFYPRRRYITNITPAANAVITMSVAHDIVAGEKISIRCPAVFGMTQIDGLTGTITAINLVTNTITVDIDSTAFTAFAFPTSAIAAGGISFPQVVPVGELGTLLTGSVRDTGTRSMFIGATICGAAGNVMDYWAIRSST